MIKNQKIKNVEDGIKQFHKLYLQHGFRITHTHAGSEFEALRADMDDLDILPYCAYKNGHIHEIEKFNQTIKECKQSSQEATPFKQLYKLVIAHLVTTGILGVIFSLSQNLAHYCPTQKSLDNFSLELSWATRRFDSYTQKYIFRNINRVNPGTQ